MQLRMGGIIRYFEGIGFGVVVDQHHTADAQRIVDVRHIFLDGLIGLQQSVRAFLLMVERLYHFRNVTTSHIDTFQLSLLVADGIDGGFVIHLTLQLELVRLVLRILKVLEVNNGTG